MTDRLVEEGGGEGGHFGGDGGGGEVADGTEVGVGHGAGRGVGASLNGEAYLAVGVAEGNAGEYEAVYVLHGEDVVVAGIGEDVGLHADVAEHKFGH